MKKKILIAILIVMAVVSVCFAFVGCGGKDTAETREVLVTYDYTITNQYTRRDGFYIGELAYKPQDPTFRKAIFYTGYGKTGITYDKLSKPKVDDFPITIEYPRMNEGYSTEVDYYFVGWYKEPEFISLWNFAEDRVYADITLYAKWIEKTW